MSTDTVQKAIAILKAEGLLFGVTGKGTLWPSDGGTKARHEFLGSVWRVGCGAGASRLA